MKPKKLNILNIIIHLESPTMHTFIPPHMVHPQADILWKPTQCNSLRYLRSKSLGSWSKIYNSPWHWVLGCQQLMVANFPCDFANRKTLNLLGAIFMRIPMSLIVDPKQFKCHSKHLFFIFFFPSSVSTCHNISTFSPVCDVHLQSHTPIFGLLLDS